MMAPPPDLTVSSWADRSRFLSPESSAEPGQWSTDRAPYLKGVMDALTDAFTEEVIFKKSAQVGGSETVLNFIGYIMDQDPGPILLIQPTLEDAKEFSKDRLEPMARDSPCLRGKLKDEKLKNRDNTTLHKRFPGGYIAIKGAESVSGLSSRPIRYALFDETSRYKPSAGAQGDPVTLGKKRTNNFYNRKIFQLSTPANVGACQISAAYEESDQRKYYVPCPSCKKKQVLFFTAGFGKEKNEKKVGGLKWDKGPKGEHLYETAYYECEHCGKRIEEYHKQRMLERGEWRAGAEFKGKAGFHINEIYSPWVKWEKIVKEFLDIKHSKNRERMKVWVNTTLGEAWHEAGGGIDKLDMMTRREG